jgi:hypothetical protein
MLKYIRHLEHLQQRPSDEGLDNSLANRELREYHVRLGLELGELLERQRSTRNNGTETTQLFKAWSSLVS